VNGFKRRVVVASLLTLAGASATYFTFQPKSAGSAVVTTTTVSSHQFSVSGVTYPDATQGTPAVRPQGEPLPSGSPAASASPVAVTDALQADFDSLLSGSTNLISFDTSTNAEFAAAFLQGHESILKTISIVPTLVSSTPQSDGSLLVDFTVAVTVDGAVWPTSFGILSGAMASRGSLTISHASLCELVSPLTPLGCPF
jgi:hypothetical protein